MDPAKVKAVVEWPTPQSRKDLQRFLGFANFYRRFIRNYSVVAASMTSLTSSSVRFLWGESAETTPDPSRQLIVEVDASDIGVEAVLSQRSAKDGKVHPLCLLLRLSLL